MILVVGLRDIQFSVSVGGGCGFWSVSFIAEDRLAEEQRQKHEAGLEEKNLLLPFLKAKDK